MPIILIVVALATALGIGGYFITKNDDVDVSVSQTAPVARPATEETADKTAADTPLVATHKDGVYEATATYITPKKTKQNVHLTLTLNGDTVTESAITFDGEADGYSNTIQENFAKLYTAEVVGKKIDDVSLSRVGGASLTTNAFNEAKDKIAAESKV